ncbi:Alpha/Beta hydrolase protein [Aspergillus karnatakaensis]|uniref:alpha/beta fold hydrolase n=1 Tax=Aspergillus karnatakaensis TaxID=1810916 RepID=UPI003CCD18FC
MADIQYLALTTKPSAQLSYTFHPATNSTSGTPPQLLVFLNGLGLPQASWFNVIAQLKEKYPAHSAILTYDRYGQGQTTDRDPNDAGAEDSTHGHDVLTVAKDLRQLITQITSEKLNVEKVEDVSLIFVANSIGCALARLYAQEYPGTVSSLLLLDSVLANSDFVSIYPDPDAADFNPASLPEGITADALRSSRQVIGRIFHPSVGSKEGLSRRNLAQLLPHADGPQLVGPGNKGPFVTIVGHDFEAFAEESTKMAQPKDLTNAFANPYWEKYNQGLVKITEDGRGKGPIQAPGSGHFVQKDNPSFVVEELVEILEKLGA